MKYPDVLEGLVLGPDEVLVLVTEDPLHIDAAELVPDELRGRVLFVSGAKAYAVVEDAAQELADKCRTALDDL